MLFLNFELLRLLDELALTMLSRLDLLLTGLLNLYLGNQKALPFLSLFLEILISLNSPFLIILTLYLLNEFSNSFGIEKRVFLGLYTSLTERTQDLI